MKELQTEHQLIIKLEVSDVGGILPLPSTVRGLNGRLAQMCACAPTTHPPATWKLLLGSWTAIASGGCSRHKSSALSQSSARTSPREKCTTLLRIPYTMPNTSKNLQLLDHTEKYAITFAPWCSGATGHCLKASPCLRTPARTLPTSGIWVASSLAELYWHASSQIPTNLSRIAHHVTPRASAAKAVLITYRVSFSEVAALWPPPLPFAINLCFPEASSWITTAWVANLRLHTSRSFGTL